MKHVVFSCLTLLCTFPVSAQLHEPAQGGMKAHEAVTASTQLTVTSFDGISRTFSQQDITALPHVEVAVTNGHSHKQETYSGVAVKDLLASVAAPKAADAAAKPKVSPRMTVIVAEGTDKFRIAMTLCDTDPGCRSGQAIVADSVDGHPLTTDGAFKLILTEDKMPGRWVRNLDALTEKNLGAM